MRRIFAFLILLSAVFGFSLSQKSVEYYTAAELSYKSGDYATALRNYELAVSYDRSLESYDPMLKFKMGICAYMVGDYIKAKGYLSGYQSDFVRELIDSIEKRQAQDEWKKWILRNRPTTPAATEIVQLPQTDQTNQGTSLMRRILILVVVFVTTFAALLFAEYRILALKRRLIELPPPTRPSGTYTPGSVEPQQQVVATEPAKALEQEELSLIPENAQVIEFDALIKSDIEIFEELLREIESGGLKPGEEAKVAEAEKGASSERFEILEEIEKGKKEIEEISNVLDELGLTAETAAGQESSQTESAEVVEKNLVDNLRKFQETTAPGERSEELTLQEFELLQKPFHEFDTLEQITERETRILVKKLLKEVEELKEVQSSTDS
ncbi:tetratricopeptide repeat protein [Fervidobacterium thailandense]|uniref:Tetratricopeptide repeat protein n=1 Tax=Fervidobacterium thailandense TaxID=1008305 RepID=A0A1E3G349_9BACT|nr:hypothetical protein [Fervidobacterium thailandense]ODN30695.1 hypothetical protein A4H02_03945 [Fervidobacterium thailandense]